MPIIESPTAPEPGEFLIGNNVGRLNGWVPMSFVLVKCSRWRTVATRFLHPAGGLDG
jgi:hypothetical protein